FMPLDDTALFLDDPLRDLEALIDESREQEASRLLILAGKPIVCRVAGKLSPPMRPEKIHFRQTEALAAALLTEDQQGELDKSGAVEITYLARSGESFAMNIFFGDGAHNAIVFLTENR